MLRFRSLGAAAALAAVLAAPAFAQSAAPTAPGRDTHAVGGAATTTTTPGATTAPSSHAGATTDATPGDTKTAMQGPAGTLHQVRGMWRSSSLVGATVYNDSGQDVGTISNLLIKPKGQVSQAVISVGGFLGIGSKLVAVPFTNLKFEPSAHDSTASTAPGMSAKQQMQKADYSVVLPGSTKAMLTKMPAFTYHES